MPSIVALIPARAGSKRCPGKNTRLLGGKPLIRWTIEAAKASGIFDAIIVSTDDSEIGSIAKQAFHNPIGTPCRVIARPAEMATDDAPDILWVRHALEIVEKWTENYERPHPDAFAILRPTSPFRTAETIKRGWREFQDKQPCHSMRAVEPVRQHPYKMWEVISQKAMYPFMDQFVGRESDGPPMHSRPTQTLPKVYIQNASLEIAWTATIREKGTISGIVVAPFFTEGHEGFDINTEEDFARAESIAASLTHV